MNNQWGPFFKELTRLFDEMRLCRVQNFISVHKSGKKNSISYTKSKLSRIKIFECQVSGEDFSLITRVIIRGLKVLIGFGRG